MVITGRSLHLLTTNSPTFIGKLSAHQLTASKAFQTCEIVLHFFLKAFHAYLLLVRGFRWASLVFQPETKLNFNARCVLLFWRLRLRCYGKKMSCCVLSNLSLSSMIYLHERFYTRIHRNSHTAREWRSSNSAAERWKVAMKLRQRTQPKCLGCSYAWMLWFSCQCFDLNCFVYKRLKNLE